MPCERILGGPAGQAGGAGAAPPAYCRWFGVECCSPGGLAARNCSALHAVTGLRMPINNLNASVSNPDMLRPLVALHSCGLVSINLEASNLIGSLTDGWGALVNLEVLNLGMAPILHMMMLVVRYSVAADRTRRACTATHTHTPCCHCHFHFPLPPQAIAG
jgi:hypothetical protein